MVTYDLLCPEKHRHEATLRSMFDDNPVCPVCQRPTARVPAAGRMGNSASAGPSRDDMPKTWLGINRGDPETVRGWHKAMTKREKLEESYPELAGDRRPVLAHEGAFEGRPLRAGDPEVNRLVQTFEKKDPAQKKPATTEVKP